MSQFRHSTITLCPKTWHKCSYLSLTPRGRPIVRHLKCQSRRFNSNEARLSSTSSQRIVYLGGILGCTSLIAAYLFWPSPSRSAPTISDAFLSPTHFTPATVVASEACIDPDTRLITLAVPPESLPPLEGSAFAPIWSIYVKDDDIQVERPYTPLEGIDEDGRMKFWIKKYVHGEVGRWLHAKKPGDTIEIRGPLRTWPWQEDLWDEIIMVRLIRLPSSREPPVHLTGC